jgi:CRP-like cAMP-binding protein
MLTASDEGRSNQLLDALPEREWHALRPFLETVSLGAGHVLCDSGQPIEYVYFPVTAIVSLLYATEHGASAEVAAVGAEGMIGVPVLTGAKTMSMRAQVQFAGTVYRMKVEYLQQLLRNSDYLRRLLLRYMQALLVQVAQTAICNRQHPVHEQVCRWLLLETDRTLTYEVPVRRQSIAELLGVRLEHVSAAVSKLQDDGLITSSRDCLSIIDRDGLIAHGCACYGVITREFSRLLPRVQAKEEVS